MNATKLDIVFWASLILANVAENALIGFLWLVLAFGLLIVPHWRDWQRFWRDVYGRVRLWVYSHLKNGIIYKDDSISLEDAYKKVRRGGYVIVRGAMSGSSVWKARTQLDNENEND